MEIFIGIINAKNVVILTLGRQTDRQTDSLILNRLSCPHRMCLPDVLCTRVGPQSPECAARAEDTTWGECAISLFLSLSISFLFFGRPSQALKGERNKWDADSFWEWEGEGAGGGDGGVTR